MFTMLANEWSKKKFVHSQFDFFATAIAFCADVGVCVCVCDRAILKTLLFEHLQFAYKLEFLIMQPAAVCTILCQFSIDSWVFISCSINIVFRYGRSLKNVKNERKKKNGGKWCSHHIFFTQFGFISHGQPF